MPFPSIRQTLVCSLLLLIFCGSLFISCGPRRLKIPGDHFLEDPRMNETSGIIASRTNPGFLYVHNDSGDSSRFFLISPDGRLHDICYFTGDTALPLHVKDCEDIAAGPGPDSSANYIYMGDIGDNNARRDYITVYRIREPSLYPNPPDSVRQSSTSPASVHADSPLVVHSLHLDADPLVLRYPDGARDAESMMVDPIGKLIYIVSKREDSVHVYSTPLNFKAHDTVTLTWKINLFFSGKGKWITAGDISPNGDRVLLKSYRKVYYWRREKNEPVWKTLSRSPAILPYIIEPQGEGIGFNLDATGYYTISEGEKPELFYYKLPSP